MEDHRSARVVALVESLIPWVRLRAGRVRHMDVSKDDSVIDTLCGLTIDGSRYHHDFVDAFRWKGQTGKPAGRLPVCGNCSNIARAIVEEADR